MGRILVALALLCSVGHVASAQPVISWRPPMNCAANDVLKFNGTVWGCSGGPAVTGSGTTNRVAKWTSGTVVGDTAFPINDSSTTLTVGDSQSSDAVTVNGRLSLTSTHSSANGFSATLSPTGSTTSFQTAGLFTSSGTFDTTGGAVVARTLYVANTATESAGSNTFSKRGLHVTSDGAADLNTAILATASGGATNRALETASGEVALNTSSGNTCIGTTGCASKLSVSGTADTDYDARVINASAFTTSKLSHSVISADTTGMTTPNTVGTEPTEWSVYGVRSLVNPSMTGACEDDNESNRCDSQKAYAIYGEASPSHVGDGDDDAYGGYFTATSSGPGNDGTLYGVYATVAGTIDQSAYAIYADASTHPGFGRALYANGPTDLVGNVTVFGSQTITTDLTLSGNAALNGNTTIGNADTDTLSISGRVNSHVYYGGTAPALSSCGTSPTIAGNDRRGTITTGSGGPTSCTITFNTPYSTNPPVCVAMTRSSTIWANTSAVSESALTFTFGSSSGLVIDYHCDGRL